MTTTEQTAPEANLNLLTLAEVCLVLRVSQNTVRRWVAGGTLRGVYRFGKGDYRFNLPEVLEGMRVRPQSSADLPGQLALPGCE